MPSKPPVTARQAAIDSEEAARRVAFCLRMGGLRDKLTSPAKARDPKAPVNRALAAWDCDDPAGLPARAVSKGVRNPVPPSSKAGRTRRVNDEAAAAADLFERFTGHEVSQAERVRVTIPNAGLVVGRCDGVLYTTVRDGKTERYIHEFRAKDAPTLVASGDGRQLILVGGRYRFTELGIVDDSDTKHRHAR